MSGATTAKVIDPDPMAVEAVKRDRKVARAERERDPLDFFGTPEQQAAAALGQPVYCGDVQLVSWGENSGAGMWGKFALKSVARDEVHPFRGCKIGKARGQRLKAVLHHEHPAEGDATGDVAYAGDAMLMHWDETPTLGVSAKLAFDDGPDGVREHPLKGFQAGKAEGEVLSLVVWLVNDDETIVPAEKRKGRRPFHQLPARLQSVLTCRDETFQSWLKENATTLFEAPPDIPAEPGEEYAREMVRAYCGVASRGVLDHDTNEGQAARRAWRELLALYREARDRV